MSSLGIAARGRYAQLNADSSNHPERLVALRQIKSRVIFVDSAATGSADGNSWAGAYTTLATAVAAAANDDTIMIAPGHAETIAAATAIDQDGIQIIGLGYGASRPTFTFSAVASSFDIDNDSVRISNCLFLTTAACTIVIDVNDTDVLIDHCEFRRSSGTHPVDWILLDGSANAADRFACINCIANTGTGTGAATFIGIDAVEDGVVISGCNVFGDFSDACIGSGSVLTNVTIENCLLTNLQTGDHSIELTAAATGSLVQNYYHNDMTQATGSDPGSCRSFECYHDDAVDTSAIVSPAVT